MWLFVISFLVGIMLLQVSTAILPIYFIIMLLLLAIFTLIFFKSWQSSKILVGLLLGVIGTDLNADYLLRQNLPSNLENTPITIIGKIQDISSSNQRYLVVVEKSSSEGKPFLFHANVRLYWKNAPAMHVGDKWQLLVKLQPAHGNLNPFSFDEEAWLCQHGIRATGYVMPSVDNQCIQKNTSFTEINRFRYAIAEKIAMQLKNNAMTGFITALCVGIRDAITPEQWQVLRATGTNHLMAIAGLHIGFVATIVFYFARWVWRRFALFTLYFPAPFFAAIVALICALVYSALAGFALPTQRAIIMLGVVLMALILRRQLPLGFAFAVALISTLIIQPLIVLSSSFWLSFVTVGLILFSLNARLAAPSKLMQWLKIQTVITIGLIPWMLWFFQQVSLIGILANLIAIPWVGMTVLPFSLLGMLSLFFSSTLSHTFFSLASTTMQWLWLVLKKLSSYAWMQWYGVMPHPYVLLTSMMAVLLLLAPRRFPARWLSGVFILPLFFSQKNIAEGQFYFTVLDIGQGLSASIVTAHHVLIYDTGPKFSVDNDAAQRVIVPFLRGKQIHQIDYLIISSDAQGNIGGANTLLTTFPTKQIISAVPDRFSPAITQACLAGKNWEWDGVNFLMLDNFCSLKITSGRNSVLITPDLTVAAQNNLLRYNHDQLSSNILLAPHQGSATAYNANFAQAVKPEYALFSTGYFNRFHLPNEKVIAAYQLLGARCLNTAKVGAINFEVTANKIIMQAYRTSHGKYWNAKE